MTRILSQPPTEVKPAIPTAEDLADYSRWSARLDALRLTEADTRDTTDFRGAGVPRQGLVYRTDTAD